MPIAATSQPPRTFTPAELAAFVKMFRESRQWSQEQLAEIARLSTRTVQRVENGQPCDLDTRRALARAFELDDIDFLNKPFSIPTPEELEVARQTVRLGFRDNAQAQPFEAAVVYIVTYLAGKEPAQFATPRKFKLG